MADTAENIAVAGTGHVYFGPEGTAMPTTAIATLDAGFKSVGYTDDGGVTMTIGRTTSDVNVWQSLDPVRVLTTARASTITLTLVEFSPENLAFALGGGTVTKGGSSGSYLMPDPQDIGINALVVEWLDGDFTWRALYERVQVQGNLAIPLTRTAETQLAVELRILASTNEAKIVSDHPAFLT